MNDLNNERWRYAPNERINEAEERVAKENQSENEQQSEYHVESIEKKISANLDLVMAVFPSKNIHHDSKVRNGSL